MRVELGHFARSGIETHVGGDLAGGVQAALRHYWRRLKSGTKPVQLPRGWADPLLEGTGASFELPVDSEIRLTLEREAERQATTADRVVLHAILIYLADLDASASPESRPSGRGNGLSPR
ncbi:MAG: hypothetical protein ACXWZM_02385 [Solirubrobacterales bacterium]